jgi:hypothetical protein
MTGGATVRRGPLGAGWERNQPNNQRNRGEALHKDILRQIAKCELSILTAVESQVRSAFRTLAVVTTWPTCRCVWSAT